MRNLTGGLLALAVLWAYLRYGATQSENLYRLFVFLCLLMLVPVWNWPWKSTGRIAGLLLLALGVFLALSIAWHDPLRSDGFILLWLGWAAFFATLWWISAGRTPVFALVYFLIALGTMEALYGLVQALAGFDYIGAYERGLGNLATGTLINRNHFAGLLNMTIPLVLGAIMTGLVRGRSRDRYRSEVLARTWLALCACALMGLAILLSLSRGGVSALVAAIVFMAILLQFDSRKRRSLASTGGGSPGYWRC